MPTVRCIDFETTGIPSETETHAVVEVGYCDAYLTGASTGAPRSRVTIPRRPVPPEAMAVHHITEAEIERDGVPIETAFVDLMDGPPDYFAAHNIEFERKFFGGGSVPWLCTYKVSLRLWPEAPSHSLQVLRYWLGISVDPELASPPHRAGSDAYVCACLILAIMERAGPAGVSLDDMLRWSSGPALLPRVTFGKHYGKPWSEVPDSYLTWILDQAGMDRDVRATARLEQKMRSTR